MKKTVRPLVVLAVLFCTIALLHATGCKKSTDKKEECRTCQAFGVDNVVDEEQVCSDAEEQAFRNKNVGHEIECH
jgi:hypothetical protein